jgi:hypothetical protein
MELVTLPLSFKVFLLSHIYKEIIFLRFQVSVAVYLKSWLFWVVMRSSYQPYVT